MYESIVAVHMPKTGGSSFLHQLKNTFGDRAILQDYTDDPVNPLSMISIDPNRYEVEPISSISPYKVVYGHFSPHKYVHLRNSFRMTFLRHPIDNVASIYYYWMAHDRNAWDSPVFRYCKDQKLTLTRFATLPKIRYLYSRSYFSGFDMTQFDFVGDYAKYDEELLRLGERLEVQFDLGIRQNVTADIVGSSETHKREREMAVETEFANLTEILKDDISFYETYKGK